MRLEQALVQLLFEMTCISIYHLFSNDTNAYIRSKMKSIYFV